MDTTGIAKACAEHFKMEYVNLTQYPDHRLPTDSITEKQLQQYAILPLQKDETCLTVALSDPFHFSLIEAIKFNTPLTVKIVFAPYDQLITLIHHLISNPFYASLSTLNKDTVDETTVTTLIKYVLSSAIYHHASDVHIEPMRHHCRFRLRIDGILDPLLECPTFLSAAIANRLKILTALDISEKRLPQDGRFTFTTHTNFKRNCRLNTCPTLFGEKLVIRILNPHKSLFNINDLGMEEKSRSTFISALHKPQGLILTTGPTGSGKTHSLYAALHFLNHPQKNISSIEEPVEIEFEGINQVNVDNNTGFDFHRALRAFLRQDPDIIMVGEIRDRETANMAIHAAHTGHLVLSTLHTNSAADTLTRLGNMGVLKFNLAHSIHLIVAQRLIRRLCSHCKIRTVLPNSVLLEAGLREIKTRALTIYRAGNCPFCTKGYKGRVGIFKLSRLRRQISFA